MEIEIAYRGTRCFSRRAILRIAMLLRDSRVAQEVRTQLLNILDEMRVVTDTEHGEIAENIEENEVLVDCAAAEEADDPAVPLDDNLTELFKTFFYGENPVRIVIRDDEPWFVAADVCKILELTNPTVATDRLDDDERAKFNLGRQGEATIINEPGLYSLVLGSRKPEAKDFKRWITHEVIPSIRRHGAYITTDTIDKMMSDPEFGIKLLTALKEEREARAAAEEQNKQLTEENEKLRDINQLLSEGVNLWDNHAVLNAMVRAAAFARYDNSFSRAWGVYYKRLAYRAGIKVKSRQGPGGLIDKIEPDEWITALQIAAAWLVELHIDVEQVINATNSASLEKALTE